MIALNRGFVAMVDAVDAYAVNAFVWHVSKSPKRPGYYARRNPSPDCPHTSIHLLVWALSGKDPVDFVDHANWDGLDCRRNNLRAATGRQNSANRPKNRNNTSGYKGVSWWRRSGCWMATIKAGGTQRFLGYFDDAADAAMAYDAAAVVAFGEFAYLNFPTKRTVSA